MTCRNLTSCAIHLLSVHIVEIPDGLYQVQIMKPFLPRQLAPESKHSSSHVLHMTKSVYGKHWGSIDSQVFRMLEEGNQILEMLSPLLLVTIRLCEQHVLQSCPST